MKNKRIEFCKVLVGNFLHRLCMPPDFVHQIVGELPSHVLLTTNSQSAWQVQLSKTNDEVFFGDGWKEFAEYYKLQENEFLFFTYYSGKEYLKVRVFATNRFEKEFVFEEVKPEEGKEKVQKSCMQVNLCKSSFPKRRACSRSLEKEFVRSKDLTANGSSRGMTYQRGNPKKQKVMQSGNCGSPVINLNENETIAGDVNDNYCATKSGATTSSVENDYFDFVVKAERLHPNHFQQLYVPSSFYDKHLRGKHQVKICYEKDHDGDDFLVLKKGSGGTISCFTSFCKHHSLKFGDKCRFEHVSDSVFKVWKINRE